LLAAEAVSQSPVAMAGKSGFQKCHLTKRCAEGVFPCEEVAQETPALKKRLSINFVDGNRTCPELKMGKVEFWRKMMAFVEQ